MKKILILKKKDFVKWPFSVDIVQVKNDGPALYIISDKIKYNLNGVAKDGESLEKIWLDNPDIPGSKISIFPIFKKAYEVFY